MLPQVLCALRSVSGGALEGAGPGSHLRQGQAGPGQARLGQAKIGDHESHKAARAASKVSPGMNLALTNM
jgi:hypothetical protein